MEMILDFTSIRSLYEAADTKTVAFLVVGEKPTDKHSVSHLTFRRTFGTLERISFEIDHYDWHWVPQVEAEEDPYIWRINLMGGGRLARLSRRFRAQANLKTFIDKHGLKYGEGFTVGDGSHTNSFLTGMRYLPSDALKNDGIDEDMLQTLTETGFERERDPSLYDAPLIVIRKNERLQMDYWTKGRLAFAIRVVGIGVGDSTPTVLKKVFSCCTASQTDTASFTRAETSRLCALGVLRRTKKTAASASSRRSMSLKPAFAASHAVTYVPWKYLWSTAASPVGPE